MRILARAGFDRRFQRLICEAFLPSPRREFAHPRLWLSFDSLQDIDEVEIGIDLVKNARCDEALDLANTFRSELRPTEEPVLPPHRDGAESSFEMIRVDRYIGIAEKDLEANPSGPCIVCRFGERVIRQECRRSEFFLEPLEELGDDEPTPIATDLEFRFTFELPLLDLGLNLVELADGVQRTS